MSIWRWLGFHDFEHFAMWCPGCFGIMVGFGGATLIWLFLVACWAVFG
jgi:hypothetical protein